MPWKETHVDAQRLQFIAEWLKEEWSMSALCREFGVSRVTGYLWVERYSLEGSAGLKPRLRAPHTHPNQLPKEIEERLLGLRHEHPTWGSGKLKAWLELHEPLADSQRWPAISTIGALLERNGLVSQRRKRYKTPPYTQPLAHCTNSNSVWSVDFKGWFRTGDGSACYPLTLSDNYSRYLLRAQALHLTDCSVVKPLMVAAFREFGLPEAIRSDNGPPFASTGLCGLSVLSIWWIKLGIRHERITPGKPQQNGRHERMHRTLKAEATIPAAADLRGQQRRLDSFRQEYNEVRPHEALGQVTPASVYQASLRRYPLRPPEPEYGSDMQVRRVHSNGAIKWQGNEHYISQALRGENIALEDRGDGEWTLWFSAMPLAIAKREGKGLSWRPIEEKKQPKKKKNEPMNTKKV